MSTGTVQFNFLHRFVRSPAPERKVTNYPTFVLGVGLPRRTMLGLAYSTNSPVATRYPNEWEFFLRHAVFSELEGAPLDLGGQIGYNLASDGVDGEVSGAKQIGPVRLLGLARLLSSPFEGEKREVALGGGAAIRVARYLALAGDVASILDRPPGRAEEAAWSVGVHLAIPNTPHSFSLQAANTSTSTLQGASRGGDRVRYGFEFTIPITLARYFGGRRATPGPAPADTAARPPTARAAPGADSLLRRAAMKNLAFVPRRLEIRAGTTVAWKNDDPLVHTIIAVDKSFDSGSIESGATWRWTFTRPGTYEVTCTPHPYMRAVIVVRPEP